MKEGMSHGEHSPQHITLAKLEHQLRKSLALMAPTAKLQAAAELARSAQLLVLKAHAEGVRYSPDVDPKRLANIDNQLQYWRTISVEAILLAYAG
jgi:hypothetical protein